MVDQLTDKLVKKALSRRGFLASAGVVTAATMVGCGNDTTFTPQQPVVPTPSVTIADSDVLNFALNLEYLEATFYLYAATGAGLPSDVSGSAGAVTIKSGAAVPFVNPLYKQVAAELAQTELQHVRALRAAITSLGGTPVAAPAIDLLNSFNAIAKAAFINGGTFDPFSSDLNFLLGAAVFEDVGVTAYTGAASLISNATVLSAAAGIQAAEAYHGATLRRLIQANAVSTGTYTTLQNFDAIQVVRATLGGGNEATLTSGVSQSAPYSFTGPSTVAAVDSNALVYARTTDQVLHIVYGTGGGAGVSSGGFLPSGANGLIKTTTA